MSRKVIFTEKQLKEILGEDVFDGVYNDMTSHGTEYPIDSIPATDHEVIPTEPGGEPFITDKYGKEKIPNNIWLRRGNYTLYEDKKKELNERNAEMDGKKLFRPTANVRKAAVPDGIHDEALARIRNGETVSIEELYTWRNRGFGNSVIDNWVKRTLNNAQTQGQSLQNVHAMANPDTNGKKIGKNNNNKIIYDFNND